MRFVLHHHLKLEDLLSSEHIQFLFFAWLLLPSIFDRSEIVGDEGVEEDLLNLQVDVFTQ